MLKTHQRRAIRRRTAIIMAYRLATIRDADRIAVIRNGEFVELGPHHALIAAGKSYADLYRAYDTEQPAKTQVG